MDLDERLELATPIPVAVVPPLGSEEAERIYRAAVDRLEGTRGAPARRWGPARRPGPRVDALLTPRRELVVLASVLVLTVVLVLSPIPRLVLGHPRSLGAPRTTVTTGNGLGTTSTTLGATAPPAGWVPVRYNHAELFVPPSWAVYVGHAAQCAVWRAPGTAWVDPDLEPLLNCPVRSLSGPAQNANALYLAPENAMSPRGARLGEVLVAGRQAIEYATGPHALYWAPRATAYFVTSLGVWIVASGALGGEVLTTLRQAPTATARRVFDGIIIVQAPPSGYQPRVSKAQVLARYTGPSTLAVGATSVKVFLGTVTDTGYTKKGHPVIDHRVAWVVYATDIRETAYGCGNLGSPSPRSVCPPFVRATLVEIVNPVNGDMLNATEY